MTPIEVSLEILRHGKPHNQLLSPLTQYIALSGQHEAVTVHVDLEHRDLLSYLKALRYQDADPAMRQLQLGRLGAELGRILGEVPGLLTDLCRPGDSGVVHLRLISSAAELALLPFELIDAPAGFPGEGYPLSLQLDVPLVITREVRCAFGRRQPWPTKPKILFAAATPPGVGTVPFEAHLAALTLAVETTGAKNIRDVLVEVLPRATLDGIRDACARHEFTHVHLLAHGVSYDDSGQDRYGLALHGGPGDPAVDIVSAERLTAALFPHMNQNSQAKSWMAHPAVVSIASCDSGNQSQVITPGSSLAHTLHTAGIPLVVASQFPLTKRGSVEMTEALYTGLLAGEDPRQVLHNVRQRLRTGSGVHHDWASLIAYTSLHKEIDNQLLDAKFESAKRGIEGSLSQLDKLVKELTPTDTLPNSAVSAEAPQEKAKLLARADGFLAQAKKHAERMPDDPIYSTESDGMRASTHKRAAESLFRIAVLTGDQRVFRHSVSELRESRSYYYRAVIARMVESNVVRKSTLPWVLCQLLCLDSVLDNRLDSKLWATAITSAEMSQGRPGEEEAAWGLGTIAELELLCGGGSSGAEHRRNAEDHIRELVTHTEVNPFVFYSTHRQFRRYVDWWGTPEFLQAVGNRAALEPEIVEAAAAFATLLEPGADKYLETQSG